MNENLPAAAQPSDARDANLVRALGVRELGFNTVNLIVGASIFVLPAQVAGVLGPAAIVAYLVCALAIGCVALCFAEAGSRVATSGGLYAYAETAFGPFVGYLAGVVTWFGSFMVGSAAVAVVFVGSIGVLFPATAAHPWRDLLLVAVYGGLAVINVLGVKAGARFVEALTTIKLAPLLLLIVVGVFSIDASNLAWPSVPSMGLIADGSLVLVFAFMGMESAVTPGGEMRDPARTVPRGILLALVLITLLYIAIQLVAQGLLGPALAQSTEAPLAAAAGQVLGNAGRTLVLAAATVSTLGYLAGDMLTAPRILYALGTNGHLPSLITRVHPRYRTPWVAIVVHAAAALAFALSGTFAKLVVLSVVSTLLIYFACAIAVLVMRHRDIRTTSRPFVIPGGPLVPVLACAVVAWLLSRATRAEYIAVGIMLAVAIVLYNAQRRLMNPAPPR
jgi:amino acid transporter